MTQPLQYHEIDLKALPALACCDDPVLRRFCSCGVRKVTDPALPSFGLHPVWKWAHETYVSDPTALAYLRAEPPKAQADLLPNDARPLIKAKPRKRHPAADIPKIEKKTGKRVTGITVADDGRVASYTFAETPAATETNPFEAEADEALAQWKRKKNANQS